MNRRSDYEGGGKTMQPCFAGTMVVIVRTGRTDGVDIAVSGDEEPVTGSEKKQAGRPSGLDGQFRQQAKNHYAQQNTGTEGHYQFGPPLESREPDAKRGCGYAHRRGQRRDGNVPEFGNPNGHASNVAVMW